MASGPSKLNGKAALGDARAQDHLREQQRHRSEALADLCGELEEEVEALRARYELYFIGVERREPSRERGELKRRVARIKSELTPNTGLRFRIETLHARFLSYERMWVRNAAQKEDGTYGRDLARARRKAGGREPPPPRADATAAQASNAAASGAGDAPAAPPTPAVARTAASSSPDKPAVPRTAAAPPAPPALPRATPAAAALPVVSGGPGEAALRALHAELVAARTACREDVSRITPEALARTVAKQVPELLAKYNARAVEYRVVVKDGRAVLKAVPRV